MYIHFMTMSSVIMAMQGSHTLLRYVLLTLRQLMQHLIHMPGSCICGCVVRGCRHTVQSLIYRSVTLQLLGLNMHEWHLHLSIDACRSIYLQG